MLTKEKILFNIFITIFLTLLIPIFAGYLLNTYMPLKYTNLLLHSALEVIGGVIAIIISLIFYIKYSKNSFLSHFNVASIGLLVMGIIDIFHGIVMPGKIFVWLHSTAVFFGGVFFMGVWLKEKQIKKNVYNLIPKIAIIFAILFSLSSIVFSNIIPMMVNEDKTFTLFANLLNIVGGIGFFIASIKFIMMYYKNKIYDDLLFAGHTILFGIAGLLFATSQIWDMQWWLWHLLRLSAYLIAFYFIYKEFFNEIRLIEITNEKLNNANSIIKESYKLLDNEKVKYHSLMDLSSDALFILDENGKLIEYSKETSKLLGYSNSEMANLNVYDWDKELTTNEYKQIVETLKNCNESLIIERTHTKKDNTTYIAQISAVSLNINENNLIYCSTRDITEQKERFNNLKKVLDLQNNIIVLLNNHTVTFANNKFFEFFDQFSNIDDFIDKHKDITELFVQEDKFFHTNKIKNKMKWIKEFNSLPNNKQVVGLLGPNFEIHAFNLHIANFDKDTYILTFNDITETKLEMLRLEEKVIRDKLTLAYNREFFEQNYKQLIRSYSSNGYHFALAVLDIDHFKQVNDNYGHDIGDYVLKEFVKTIKNCTREDDVLIRWGGEEFILLLKVKHQDDLFKALEHISKIIENINFDKVGKKTCSIGATFYKDNEDIKLTIKRADEAVYDAKANGRNQVVIK